MSLCRYDDIGEGAKVPKGNLPWHKPIIPSSHCQATFAFVPFHTECLRKNCCFRFASAAIWLYPFQWQAVFPNKFNRFIGSRHLLMFLKKVYCLATIKDFCSRHDRAFLAVFKILNLNTVLQILREHHIFSQVLRFQSF